MKVPPVSLPPLILASASPRRAELLRQSGFDFGVAPAAVAEGHPEYLTPSEICQLNAYHKARAVAKKHMDSLVLGADTVVCLGTTVFGKPANHEAARGRLARLQGRTHQVITVDCLIHLRSHRQKLFDVST